MSGQPIRLRAGDWLLDAIPESTFAFNPAKPVTYWVIQYETHQQGERLSTMLEHVGHDRPTAELLWQTARDDYAKRRGIAAA